MIPLEDASSLSSLYHLNSEPWLNDAAYSAAYHQEFKEFPGAERLRLPPPRDAELNRLLRARKSCRRFRPEALPVESLSALVMAAAGIIDRSEFPRRAAPSAGGLYPLELYAVIDRAAEVPAGLYHYDPRSHSLQVMDARPRVPDLASVFYTYAFMENAAAVFAFAAVFGRTQKKYGPRGYRYVLLEAGHAAQNLCLMAAELGLGSLCMGGYKDSAFNRLLGLEEPDEGIVYSIAVGVPAV